SGEEGRRLGVVQLLPPEAEKEDAVVGLRGQLPHPVLEGQGHGVASVLVEPERRKARELVHPLEDRLVVAEDGPEAGRVPVRLEAAAPCLESGDLRLQRSEATGNDLLAGRRQQVAQIPTGELIRLGFERGDSHACSLPAWPAGGG